MTTTLSHPIAVAGYFICGCDDWLVFARDGTGNWFYWHTECDPHWLAIGACSGRNAAGLGDDPPTDIIACAVLMARDGVMPRPIDPDCRADIRRHFGAVS